MCETSIFKIFFSLFIQLYIAKVGADRIRIRFRRKISGFGSGSSTLGETRERARKEGIQVLYRSMR